MQQQLAGAGLVVVGDVAVGVRSDMKIEQKGFAVLDQAVGVFEVGFALADGFDLRPAQADAGLELLQQEVVMAGRAVVRRVALAAGDGIAWLGGLLRASCALAARSRGWFGGPSEGLLESQCYH